MTEETRALIAALREVIEALDRRVPVMERAGEVQIRRQAAELRSAALVRIRELTEADEAVSPSEAAPADAVMTEDDGRLR